MKQTLTVSIVIPNWNGVHLLKKHLPVVINHSPGVHIIVVDDCSTDDSVRYLKKYFPNIEVIKKDAHEGFASTVNRGIKEAKTDIVILLNTDIEPEKEYLSPLLSHFKDSLVFAVGCMDKSHENEKVILRGRGIGIWKNGFYIHKRGEVNATDTDWVSGGSGAFRTSIWNELGGMDLRFNPFYWEDIDISYRAVQKGYRIIFEPKSVVHHMHEQGSIKETFSKNYIQKIAYRNQFLFEFKHLPTIKQKFLFLFWTPVRLIQTIAAGDISMTEGFFWAIIRYFVY